jgi:hypothetical protein
MTPMENKTHEGNYRGTTAMSAENQDMEFVNDTLEQTKNTTPVNIAKDDSRIIKQKLK